MATVSPILSYGDLRDNASIWKMGLDDKKLDKGLIVEPSVWRSDSATVTCTSARHFSTPSRSWLHKTTSNGYIEPPPPYSAAIKDAPPCYDTLQLLHYHQSPVTQYCSKWQWHIDFILISPPISFMTPVAIDLNDTSNFRQAVSRNKKKAQKQADQARWADNGDEGAKDGGDGGDNAGGGGGAGGSNNGDGGAGDDGGWDDWNTGGGKKKKGKKGKNAVDEEEEKKKKEEEEEKKRKEEEGSGAADPLAWMNDEATKADDDWAGFTSTDKKGKKNKKNKAEPAPDHQTQNAFDDISLNDTPRIDLSFGNETSTKTSGSGFGFGGWSSSWNTSNETGAGATDITDFNNDASGNLVDSMWSFGKKSKKTTNTLGFDFGNFGAVDETPEIQATNGGDQDDWTSGFVAPGKKNKKNKKNAIEDPSSITDMTAIDTAVRGPTATDESWGAWNNPISKKNKSKKKENDPEPVTSDVPPVPPPPPLAPAEPPADDAWSAFGAKNKKKGKKGTIEEPVVTVPDAEPEVDMGWGTFGAKKDMKKTKKDAVEDKPTDDAPIVVVGDPDRQPVNDFNWGFTSKKEKRKGKKGQEDDKEPETAIVEVPENDTGADLGWGSFGMGKNGKKKGKKDAADEEKIKEQAPVVVPDAEPETGFDWGSFGGKKDKKKGKKVMEEVEPKNDDIEDPDPTPQTGWGAFGSKKDSKKSKNSNKDASEDTHVVQVPAIDPITEDSFDVDWGTTTKKGKKDKRGGIATVQEDPITAVDSTAATEAGNANDDWMNWSDKKKDKKGKKGTAEAKKDEHLPPPPPPPPPDVPDTSSFDAWSSTKKDKKGKKGKTVEPEPAIVEVPDISADKKEEVEADDWGTTGLSAKDKKKKEKEKRKEKEMKEMEEQQRQEQEELERKESEAKEKEKVKPGKKSKASAPTTASKTNDLLADSIPDITSAGEVDTWGGVWGSSKKDNKKKAGKESPFAVPPPVPTPPAQGLTPPPDEDLDDLLEDPWGSSVLVNSEGMKNAKKSFKEDESKASKTEESAAKAARSFWGGMASTTTSKAKNAKEKEKEKEKEKKNEQAKKELDFDAELDLDEIVDIVEEEPPPPKKGSKSKTNDSKLSKSSDKAAKSSIIDKKAKADAETDALIDFNLEEPEPKDGKSKTAEASKSKGDDKKGDAWSFWGSSKKTSGNSGKKGDEPKKEINKQEATNQNDPLAFLSNEPEESFDAYEPKQSPSPKNPKSAMSTSKATGKLSVAQKVKALEEEKKRALEPPAPLPVLIETEKPEPLAKKVSATSKTKAATASKFASKKDPSPPPTENEKKSKDSVPGSFPAEGIDEENLIDMLATSPPGKTSAKKGSKPPKRTKEAVIDIMDVEMPAVPAAPPTPPAEPAAAKPAKKERARVVRDEGASSWGFWGAAPKKDPKKSTKAKDDGDVPSSKKTAPAGLVRSKSTKTTKEKGKDTEKSSASDGKEKTAESRPSKPRGSSFGAFFGGPPPVRAKTVRRTSTSAASKMTSRRQSMDVDAFGLPSPPPEDSPGTAGKAAKLMGTASSKQTNKVTNKGKQKAPAVPDPYPINDDDDDMIMVDGLEDPIMNAPVPKTSSKNTKWKGSKSKPSQGFDPVVDAGDDVVMVDGPSQEEPEPLAFEETPKAPPPMRRSATSAKKPNNGKLMGLFGGFGKTRRNSETFERPKSKAVVTDDEGLSPRKRAVDSRENSSKRIRREDRKIRRTGKPDRENEVFITDALNEGGVPTEAEDAELRRQERRAKREVRDSDAYVYPDRHARRDGEDKPAEGSRSKAKTSERRSKREEGEDSHRQEEKRSRRAEKEERPAKETAKHSSSRPHTSDRRRSYMDKALASDRPKAHRSRTERSSSKRRSVAANGVVDDYIDPGNAVPEAGKNEPYMHGANDHTSSWVKSQLSDPADPPPVEGTVIEPTPELGGKGGYERGDDEEGRRAARRAKRQSRYGAEGDSGDPDRERRRRRREKESEGSAEWGGGREREKLSRRYTDMGGIRGAGGGRPSLGAAGKGGSWLKKVTGLGM
ncbi:MAG: hypothetical protein Q9181_003049 [Wetmoreana brouardii]